MILRHLIAAAVVAGFGLPVAAAPPVPSDESGDWQISRNTRPLDGTAFTSAALQSETQILNSIGRPLQAALVLQCYRGKPDVALQWTGYLGPRGRQTTVSWRADSQPIHNENWQIAPGVIGALFQGERGARGLIAAINGAQKLTIRVAGQDAVFDISRGGSALAAIESDCPNKKAAR